MAILPCPRARFLHTTSQIWRYSLDRRTDYEYCRTTKAAVRAKQKRAFSLFAGTCAVGGLVDLETCVCSTANLGKR